MRAEVLQSAGDHILGRDSIPFRKSEAGSRRFPYLLGYAYCVHHLYEDKQDYLLEILMECKKAGNPDMYTNLHPHPRSVSLDPESPQWLLPRQT